MDVPKLSGHDKVLWKTFMFLVRLLLLSVPLYTVLWLNVSMVPLQDMVSGNSAWLLNVMGISAEREGMMLTCGTTDPFVFYIGPDCTGWKSMVFFFALVFATLKVSMKKRLLGLAVGIPLIYAGNLVRIMVSVMVERIYGYDAAMFIHDWLWQAGLISLVLLLWVAWLRWDVLKKHIIALRER